MRDDLSETRRKLWLLDQRIASRVAEHEARIAAAEVILASAADRDLEQVYTAQHQIHTRRAAVDALVSCRAELLLVLGVPGELGGSKTAAPPHW